MTLHTIDIHVPGLKDVLQETYDLAFFDRNDKPYYKSLRPTGLPLQPSNWALDMRVPLSSSRLLQPITAEMASYLEDAGFTQVAGYGYGSFSLVGGILARATSMNGAFVRPERKPYGFGKIVEGNLRGDLPVVIVDDLLGAGQSALRAAAALRAEGFTVTGVYTVFRFGWRQGRRNLQAQRLAHRCLATLRRGDGTGSVAHEAVNHETVVLEGAVAR
jgi:orotate phosphoribosyltransferase